MLSLALVALAAIFILLFVARVGAARRVTLIARWPAVALALAALFALARGALWPAIALGSLAALAWELWPRLNSRPKNQQRPTSEDPADAEARAVLGVAANATDADIRAAYRSKMAQAHPDLGGSHNEAARLTAARDRLLKRKK